MTEKEAEAWFEEISQRRDELQRTRLRFEGEMLVGPYETAPAASWANEAEAAVLQVFGAGHPVGARMRRAREVVEARTKGNSVGLPENLDEITGAFEAARSMLKKKRVHGLVEGIQAETVGQVLEQADALLAKGYVVAAAVLAGGALETHLLHLCQRAGATSQGDGSISRYNGAIGQLRNNGTIVYSANDGKSVEAWGGTRNDAAHSPATFKKSADEVGLMVVGIRQFITRNP